MASISEPIAPRRRRSWRSASAPVSSTSSAAGANSARPSRPRSISRPVMSKTCLPSAVTRASAPAEEQNVEARRGTVDRSQRPMVADSPRSSSRAVTGSPQSDLHEQHAGTVAVSTRSGTGRAIGPTCGSAGRRRQNGLPDRAGGSRHGSQGAGSHRPLRPRPGSIGRASTATSSAGARSSPPTARESASRPPAFSSASGRTHHELLLIEVGPDAAAQPAGRRVGLYHFGLKVGDTDDELREAVARLQGDRHADPRRQRPHRDPQPLHRRSGRQRDRALHRRARRRLAHGPGPHRRADQAPPPLTGAVPSGQPCAGTPPGSSWSRNCAQRAASSSSPMVAAVRPRPRRQRRKPRLSSSAQRT